MVGLQHVDYQNSQRLRLYRRPQPDSLEHLLNNRTHKVSLYRNRLDITKTLTLVAPLTIGDLSSPGYRTIGANPHTALFQDLTQNEIRLKNLRLFIDISSQISHASECGDCK